MKKLAIILIISATIAINNKVYPQIVASVRVTIAPPILPVYVQPACPVEGYLWEPGYWAWDGYDYYWVPGVWVAPPYAGLYWTPGYWGFVDGVYLWNAGYWGPHVGFYGGVCYGYGYWGTGFYGGRWDHGVYHYNTAVVKVNSTVVHHTYVDRGVINDRNSRVSFNGRGGTTAQPTAAEKMAMNEKHVPITSVQQAHQQAASRDKSQHVSVNKGNPAVAAMNKVNGQQFNREGHAAGNAAPAERKAGNAQHSGNNIHTNPAPVQHNNRLQPQNSNHAMPQRNNMAPQHRNNPVLQHQVNRPATMPPAHRQQPERAAPVQPHSRPAPAMQQQHAPAPQHFAPQHANPGGPPREMGGGRPAGGGPHNPERH